MQYTETARLIMVHTGGWLRRRWVKFTESQVYMKERAINKAGFLGLQVWNIPWGEEMTR